MGVSFERYNAAWLKRLVKETLGQTIRVEVGRKEKDLLQEIHSSSTEVEIDLWVDKPFVIGEATTFLGPKEMAKIEKFVKIGQWISKRYGKEPKLYLFCMGIHSDIVEVARTYCRENGVVLVCQVEE